jgi:myo-inositol-1(or 4)-monophosphatase
MARSGENMYQKDLWIGLKAARAGAAVVREGFGTSVITEFKGEADPVTAIDRSAEQHVLSVIHHHFPQDHVLAEESARPEGQWTEGRVWLVDPLDGTVNFIHAIPHIAVSVALWVDGQPAAAVIIDVIRGEELTATVGGGAFSGANPIRVSSQTRLSHSLIATGFAYDRNHHGLAYAENMGPVLTRAQGIRRFGSAALDFAWVACGRYEGYWEFGLKPWDAAAGVLLVTEAGGKVSSHTGVGHQLGDAGVVASNRAIHGELLEAVGAAVPRHLR